MLKRDFLLPKTPRSFRDWGGFFGKIGRIVDYLVFLGILGGLFFLCARLFFPSKPTIFSPTPANFIQWGGLFPHFSGEEGRFFFSFLTRPFCHFNQGDKRGKKLFFLGGGGDLRDCIRIFSKNLTLCFLIPGPGSQFLI